MSGLKQEITLMSGIGQLSTTLLGTGLFMVPAIVAGIAGQYSLWAWLLLFLAICPIALTFAQLGKRYPNAGGTAFFVRQAFSAKLEKSVAWLFMSIIPVGVPAAIALTGGFLQQLLPSGLDTSLIAQLLTIGLLMLVSIAGSKSSGQLQMAIALSIFVLVTSFWIRGDITIEDISMPTLNAESGTKIGAALAVMFWCFVGIEAFAHMGEEFKNPQRDFPIAIIVGSFVAGSIYWACSVVILKFGAYGTTEFDSASIPWLSEHLFGPEFKLLISALGFFACFASINLYTQSLARMLWAQARNYHPKSHMAHLSSRGVPTTATFAIGGVLIVSCIIGELSNLNLEFFVKLANSVFVLIYLLAMVAAVKLLKGLGRILAYIAMILCTIVFLCLGWSMFYALTIFAILLLPWEKWRSNYLTPSTDS